MTILSKAVKFIAYNVYNLYIVIPKNILFIYYFIIIIIIIINYLFLFI